MDTLEKMRCVAYRISRILRREKLKIFCCGAHRALMIGPGRTPRWFLSPGGRWAIPLGSEKFTFNKAI
jgi:hypothetical protein